MKRFVDGIEAELDPSAATVISHGDRLIVKTANGAHSALAIRTGDKVLVSYQGRQFTVEKAIRSSAKGGAVGSGEIRSPMPGLIVDVLVTAGDSVAKGAKLVVLEAMKTQQAFPAPFDGVVESVEVVKGAQVVDNQILVKVRPNEA